MSVRPRSAPKSPLQGKYIAQIIKPRLSIKENGRGIIMYKKVKVVPGNGRMRLQSVSK